MGLVPTRTRRFGRRRSSLPGLSPVVGKDEQVQWLLSSSPTAPGGSSGRLLRPGRAFPGALGRRSPHFGSSMEEPCTSIDEPESEATWPEAPGKARPGPEPPDDPPGAVGEEDEPLDVLVEPPPQAARPTERARATAAAERDLRVRVGTDPMRESPCVSRGDIIRCGGRRSARAGQPARPGRRRTPGRWRRRRRRRTDGGRGRQRRWVTDGPGRSMVPAYASRAPTAPPSRPSTEASKRNWRRMAAGVAPSALRSPISRIRSVTDTSMMFMTPMPPDEQGYAGDPGQQDGQRPVHRGGGGDERLLRGDGEVGVGGMW